MKAKVKKVTNYNLGLALLGGKTHYMTKGKRCFTSNEVMDMLGLRHYKPWEPEYNYRWKL